MKLTQSICKNSAVFWNLVFASSFKGPKLPNCIKKIFIDAKPLNGYFFSNLAQLVYYLLVDDS